jgi:hypothetical protein
MPYEITAYWCSVQMKEVYTPPHANGGGWYWSLNGGCLDVGPFASRAVEAW